MKISLTIFAALAVCTAANATVVNFDDLTGTGTVIDGYGGINWSGNWTYYDGPQSPYNAASGSERVYDLPSGGNSFSFVAPSTFQGASFAGYNFAGPISFDMYDGATLVATSGTLTPSSNPTFLSSGYSGMVTSVVVNSSASDFFVMDNVTYNGSPSAPSPAAILPMLSGFGLMLRKRNK